MKQRFGILDSISFDGQKRLVDMWDSRRWNHAASAACAFLKGDDLPSMMRTVDNSPPSLKPLVRLTIVSECFTEAVAVINRTNETKSECSSPGTAGSVFSNTLIANSYKLPANLLEKDDVGVRYALSSVRPADKRAMSRLQLLKDVLAQETVTLKAFL